VTIIDNLFNKSKLFFGKRRWIRRTRFFPFDMGFAYINVCNGKKIFLEPNDMQGPSFHILYGGEAAFKMYELVDKNEILIALRKTRGMFLDVGANIGLFSFYVALNMPECEIMAFEPNPKSLQCLKKTCLENNFSNITISSFALSDVAQDITLYCDTNNDGAHTILKEKLEMGPSVFETLIHTKSLDELWKFDSEILVSVIKVDIQGFELNMLRGAQKTIKKYLPLILVECDNKNLLEDENVYTFLLSLSTEKTMTCRHSGENIPLDLSDIKNRAIRDLNEGLLERNLIFSWN